MKYRKLGNTGILVSEVGFGSWGIGGTRNGAVGYGKTDDKTSIKAIKKAIDVGINFFDTSPLYGFGHSEKLIGNTTHMFRDKVVIATKVGYLNFRGDQNFSIKHILQSVEKSLNRLKTDYIDILQLHDPKPSEFQNRKLQSFLQSLISDGKVRFIGVSLNSPEDGLLVAKNKIYKVIQFNYNLTDLRAKEIDLFKICGSNKIGLISRTPLAFGYLTGKFGSDTKLSSNDHRKRWSKKQIDQWTSTIPYALENNIIHGKQSYAQLAIRFCLSENHISTVIPGMLTPKQVEENSRSSDMGKLNDFICEYFYSNYTNHSFLGKL